MQSKGLLSTAAVLAIASNGLGAAFSIAPGRTSQIQDISAAGTSTTNITSLMTGVNTSPISTGATESTAFTLTTSDLRFVFTDAQTTTDFQTENIGTVYFTVDQTTTYNLSGSFSGLGTGFAADNFGVNLTQVIVQGGTTNFVRLFASSGVNGSLASPSSSNGFPSESGNLSGTLNGGATYFLSYDTGAHSAASNGFVELAINTPEPLSSSIAFGLCSLFGLRRRRRTAIT